MPSNSQAEVENGWEVYHSVSMSSVLFEAMPFFCPGSGGNANTGMRLPKWPNGFVKVACVLDESPEIAFEKTNTIDNPWYENQLVRPTDIAKKGARSTSVGDILVKYRMTRRNGKKYYRRSTVLKVGGNGLSKISKWKKGDTVVNYMF